MNNKPNIFYSLAEKHFPAMAKYGFVCHVVSFGGKTWPENTISWFQPAERC